ncbi:MAG: VCBS repeat-containing protein, partial [Planctomycetaceae bacterium]|nr:VCBS repeat-containing protein [Planctomycetaceae bacterium]
MLKTLQAERDVPEILDALVQGYLRSGQYAKAEVSLSTWRTMLPHDVRPYVLRGMWFMQLANWTSATGELREALRRKPNDPETELLLAEALLGDKHAGEASGLFRRCLQVWPERESVVLGLARAMIANGEAIQAAQLLPMFLERNPNSTEIRRTLGEALLNSGRAQDAIRVLQPAAERSAQNVEIRYLLGTVLRIVGRSDEAEPHLSFVRQARQELQEAQRLREHVLQDPQDQTEKLKLASLLLKYEQDVEAMIWLQSLLAEQPQHSEGQRLLAELYRRKADRDSNLVAATTVPRPFAVKVMSPNNVTPAATSDWAMTDVTSDVGIDFAYRNGRESGHATVVETIGGGVAWLDADLDGRLDLFLTGGGSFDGDRNLKGHSPALFRQITAERFEPITHSAHLETAPFYSHGVAVADHDQDGFPDLLVTGYAGLLFFHNQGDGTFRECSHEVGLTDDRWSTSAGWGDLNGD